MAIHIYHPTSLAEALWPRSGIAREAALVLSGSLLVALTAQVAIPLPFSPVPVTGQSFGVLLVGALLGSRRGALSLLAYLGEGALGLPVLAGGTGGLAVWIPLAADLTPANTADNEAAPALLRELPAEARFILGDRHYNAPNVQEACDQAGRILVTTQYGPYPHTGTGVAVRRVFHKLRSTAIEKVYC